MLRSTLLNPAVTHLGVPSAVSMPSPTARPRMQRPPWNQPGLTEEVLLVESRQNTSGAVRTSAGIWKLQIVRSQLGLATRGQLGANQCSRERCKHKGSQ